MKILLLTITILLLIHRIKSTPRMLSKTIYLINLSKNLDNLKNQKKDTSDDYFTLAHIISIGVTIFIQALIILYYLLIGNRFLSNTMMLILTALQIVTVFITCEKQIKFKEVSFNIEDYKFHRFYFLFNVVLDYIYYPMAIYLLIA